MSFCLVIMKIYKFQRSMTLATVVKINCRARRKDFEYVSCMCKVKYSKLGFKGLEVLACLEDRLLNFTEIILILCLCRENVVYGLYSYTIIRLITITVSS